MLVFPQTSRDYRVPTGAQRSKGLGMLEVMILIAVLSSLLVAGFLQWRVRSYENTSRQEQIKLTQADAALMAFATVARRLPCPDTDRDGLEDCGSNAQKGWLPVKTLLLAGADAGVSAGQLRYLVQRGSPAIDLATLSDEWRPFAYDSNAVSTLASDYAGAGTSIQTVSDLCSRLATGSTTAVGAGLASVASATPRLVAFALAHPGNEDGDGDGDLFDGANAISNATQLEPSDRRFSLALYDDVVLERSMGSVQAALGCTQLNNSIDAVALSADTVDMVANVKEGNISDAKKAIIWASIGAALSAAAAVDTGIGLASDATNAGIELVGCAASLGIAANLCAAAGIHAGAAGLAGAEIALNVASTIASLVAVGNASAALVIADSDATSSPQPCTVPDNSSATAALSGRITRAEAELADMDNRRNTLVANKASAEATRNAVIADLRVNVLNSNPAPASSNIDNLVTALLSNANTLMPLQTQYDAAVAQQADAQTAYDTAAEGVTRYQNMIDNRATMTVSVTAALSAASQTLANLRSSNASTQTIADQEQVVFRLRGDLQMLTESLPAGQTPSLVATRDRFIADRDVTATNVLTLANTELTNATNARAAAASSYGNSYSALYIGSMGNYTITIPTFFVTPIFVVSCTAGLSGGPATCGTSTVSTFSGVNAKLIELFGYANVASSTAPHPSSTYAMPEKIQKEINVLDEQRTPLVNSITDLRTQLANLSTPIAMPAACTLPSVPARPMNPAEARNLLINVDRKGGTR